jgi:hypothetical protein
MRGNFLKLDLLEKYPDQFEPFVRFQNIFGCTMKEKFNGTVFRLPLRNNNTISLSDIRKKPALKDATDMLAETEARIGDMLQFIQHVEKVEVFECHPQQSPVLCFGVAISTISPELRAKRQLKPSTLVTFPETVEIFRRGTVVEETWRICNGLDENVSEFGSEGGKQYRARAGVSFKMKVF